MTLQNSLLEQVKVMKIDGGFDASSLVHQEPVVGFLTAFEVGPQLI